MPDFSLLVGLQQQLCYTGCSIPVPHNWNEISYSPSTYRKMLHMNLIFVATQRKTQRCHLLPLIVERPSFPTWHSQKQPEDPDASILPGSVKVVNIIQLLEIEKHGWKNKKTLFCWLFVLHFTHSASLAHVPVKCQEQKKRRSGQLCECIVALPPLVSLPFSPTGQGHASSHTQWGGLVWF